MPATRTCPRCGNDALARKATVCRDCVRNPPPTPAEIQQRTAEIRAKWTDRSQMPRGRGKRAFPKETAIRMVSVRELIEGLR